MLTAALIIGIVRRGDPDRCSCSGSGCAAARRWARRATEARNLSRLPDGPDLLALRALVNADFRELHDIHGEPVDAWRRGEKKVVRALAQLELREAGVRLSERLERVGAHDDLGRHRGGDGAVGRRTTACPSRRRPPHPGSSTRRARGRGRGEPGSSGRRGRR